MFGCFREIDQEETVINLIAHFYNLNYLYIPPRPPGQPIPKALSDFYFKALASLKQKLAKEELLAEATLSPSSSVSQGRKRSRSSRYENDNVVLFSTITFCFSGKRSLVKAVEATTDPLTHKQPHEIEALLTSN